MENQEKKTTPADSNDLDLGTVLQLFIRGINNLCRLVMSFFQGIINTILVILIFLKRRIWWIIGALVVGYAWGSYQNYQNGVKYHSTMTARFNFGSTRSLYSSIEYLNNLLGEGRRAEVAQLLSITPEEAASLRSFEAEPVTNEREVSELYKELYLGYNRGAVRLDTVWTKLIPYKEFRGALTKYDYPTQTVTAVGTRPDLFAKVQQGFINVVVSNGDLQRNLEMRRAMQQEEAEIILSSLHGLDTLRNSFNELLRKGGDERPPTTTMSITQQDKTVFQTAPEIDLYNKVMQFKDELKLARQNEINNREIVQVSAGFSQVGRKSNIFKQQTASSAIQALTLLFLVFIIMEIFRALSRIEKVQKQKQQAG